MNHIITIIFLLLASQLLNATEQKKRKTYNCFQKQARILSKEYLDKIKTLPVNEQTIVKIYIQERLKVAHQLVFGKYALNMYEQKQPCKLAQEIAAIMIEKNNQDILHKYAEYVTKIAQNPLCNNIASGKIMFVDEVDFMRIILASKAFSKKVLDKWDNKKSKKK